MVEFMFDESLHHVSLIDKAKSLFKFALHTHFLLQAAISSIMKRFTVARVATAGIGPEARGMVFGQSPLLEKHFVFAIEDKDREGAMKGGIDMSFHFLHQANLIIKFIDEHNVFCHHTLNLILIISPSLTT